MAFTGQKLLMLGAGYFQVPAIKKARELGLEVIAISNISTDPGLKAANKGVVLSTLDKEAVLRLAQSEKINGVITVASEVAAPTVAFIAQKLQLPGYSYAAATTIANKLLLRQKLHQSGISYIRFGDASTPEMALSSLNSIAGPAMLKPLLSSGSRGIRKIGNTDELLRHLPDAIGQSFTFKGALLEEFVPGTPLSGELIICNKEIVAEAFSTKTYNSYYVTTSQSMPASLAAEQLNLLRQLCQNTVAALGLENGALDLDLVLTNNSIEIIELGGRLGGNGMADLASLHTGTDFTEAAIRIAMGEKVKKQTSLNRPVAVYIIGSEKAGTLKEVKDFTTVFPGKTASLIYQSTFFAIGSHVKPLTQGNFQVGTIMLTADTPQQLTQLLQQVQAVQWALVH